MRFKCNVRKRKVKKKSPHINTPYMYTYIDYILSTSTTSIRFNFSEQMCPEKKDTQKITKKRSKL